MTIFINIGFHTLSSSIDFLYHHAIEWPPPDGVTQNGDSEGNLIRVRASVADSVVADVVETY